MTEQEKPGFKSPYEIEITNSKRSRRSKVLILSSGVVVGASLLVGAAIAVNQEITEDQVQEQLQDQTPEAGTAKPTAGPESDPPPSLDPQGKFTPGYAEGEESEHVGSDEDHPENLYHEDEADEEDDD